VIPPHHKHIPPDSKHNRIPAPGLSFTEANLPFLIREVEGLGGDRLRREFPSGTPRRMRV